MVRVWDSVRAVGGVASRRKTLLASVAAAVLVSGVGASAEPEAGDSGLYLDIHGQSTPPGDSPQSNKHVQDGSDADWHSFGLTPEDERLFLGGHVQVLGQLNLGAIEVNGDPEDLAERDDSAAVPQHTSQKNLAVQSLEGGEWIGRGADEEQISDTLSSGGVEAQGGALFLGVNAQILGQANVLVGQAGGALAATENGDAAAEVLQALKQKNRAEQAIGGGDWTGMGTASVENSGALSSGDVVAQGGALFLGANAQVLGQANVLAGQAGGALAATAEGNAAAEVLQALKQKNDAVQVIGGGDWRGMGAASVENSGALETGDVVAQGDALFLGANAQVLGQANALAGQAGGALAATAQGDASTEVSQALKQKNDALQAVEGSDWTGMGAAGVANSGTLGSGDVIARGGAFFLGVNAQVLGQANALAGQAGGALSLAEDDATADVAQALKQKNDAVQDFGGGDWTGMGAAGVENSGALTSGDVVAQGGALFLGANAQVLGQANALAGQAGGALSLAGRDAGAEVSQTLKQKNNALQAIGGGDWTGMGAAGVLNNGAIGSGGLLAQGDALFLGVNAQVLGQANTLAGQAGGALSFASGDAGAEISQTLKQKNDGTQLIRSGDWTAMGAAGVQNSGEVTASGDAMVAEGDAALLSADLQILRQSNEHATQKALVVAGSRGAATAGAHQDMIQENAAIQVVTGSNFSHAGWAGLENSGRLTASRDGLLALGTFNSHGAQQQSVTQTNNAARQRALVLGAGAEGDEPATLHQDLAQLNQSDQVLVSDNGLFAGAVEVRNSGDVLAGDHGILADSLFTLDARSAQDAVQENRGASQHAGALALSAGEQPAAQGEQSLDQENVSGQLMIGGDWMGAGAVDVVNEGAVEAEHDGIDAVSDLEITLDRTQDAHQDNSGGQRGLVAQLNMGGAANAWPDQYFDQHNEAVQVVEGGAWQGAGTVTIHNSGAVQAEDDGLRVESKLRSRGKTVQEVAQVNVAGQAGAAAAGGFSSSPAAHAGQYQGLSQANGAIQERLGGDWRAAGAVSLSNSNTIQAGDDGLWARSGVRASRWTRQQADQGNLSAQLGLAAGGAVGEGAESIAGQDRHLDQDNASIQSVAGGDWSAAGAIFVHNSGMVVAEEDGVRATSDVALREGVLQDAQQGSGALQAGLAAAGAWREEASATAGELQQLEQDSLSVQLVEGGRHAVLGAVAVDNGGLVVAGDDGLVARSNVTASTWTLQETVQINGALQAGAALAGASGADSEAAAAAGQHLNQDNTAIQVVQQGDWSETGAVALSNRGLILAEDDGLVAESDVRAFLATRQHADQANLAAQATAAAAGTEGSGSERVTGIDRHFEQDNLSVQVADAGDWTEAGAISVSNEGLIAAGGDGIVADSLVASGLYVEQHAHQGNEVARFGDTESSSLQLDEQWNVSTQEADGGNWQWAGAVAVTNSGAVAAGGDGIVATSGAYSYIAINQDVEQDSSFLPAGEDEPAVEQAGVSSQTVVGPDWSGMGAVSVHNDGLVEAGRDGISAQTRVHLGAWVEQQGGALQSAELGVGEGAGAARIVNEGLVEAERHGLVAESNVSAGLYVNQDPGGETDLWVGEEVGAVTVENRGVVLAGEDGIRARAWTSLNGDLEVADNAGSVTVVNDGIIAAGGTGIDAASDADGRTAGAIEIEVGTEGVVLAEEGVRLRGGSDNSVLNRGAILARGDHAVRGGDGNERVTNHGWIRGNVDLGGGSNGFDNRVNGLFEPGDRVDLGGGVLDNRGTLSPGGSGTIEHTAVGGDLRQRDGSILVVDIEPEGNADRLDVSGRVRIDEGAGIVVEEAPGDYALGQEFRFLNAGGGIEGTYAAAHHESLFLEYDVIQGRDWANLRLDRNSTGFDEVAITPNQRGVARVLDTLDSDNPVYDALVWMQDEKQAQEFYDSLSGEVHATANNVPFTVAHRLRHSILNRLAGLSGGNASGGLSENNLASLAISDAGTPPAPEAEGVRPAVWLQVFGSHGSMDGDGNAAATSSRGWGVALGGELLLSDRFGVGLMGAYQSDRLDVDDRSSRAEIGSYTLGTYALWRPENWRLRGGATFSWHDFDTERAIRMPTETRTAEADYDGWTVQSFAEAGYRFEFEDIDLEPFAGLAHTYTRTDGYTERGAGAANLTAESDRQWSLVSSLGLRLSEEFTPSDRLQLRPYASVAWERRLAGTSMDSNLAFEAGGDRFRVSGPERSRNSAAIGVGINFTIDGVVEGFGAYDLNVSRTHGDHAAKAGIKLRF